MQDDFSRHRHLFPAIGIVCVNIACITFLLTPFVKVCIFHTRKEFTTEWIKIQGCAGSTLPFFPGQIADNEPFKSSAFGKQGLIFAWPKSDGEKGS